MAAHGSTSPAGTGVGQAGAAPLGSSPALGGQNTLDIYRHGKPSAIEAGTTRLSTRGGKVAYNILYCDGHVTTATDPVDGYRAVRQRFPG